MIKCFDDLKEKLAGGPRRRMAVASSDDAHTLEAVMRASVDGMVEPVLLGDAAETKRILSKMGYREDLLEIIDLPNEQSCAEMAALMARDGKVDCIMKGRLETSVIMHAILDREKGLRRRELLSGFGMFETPHYHKMFAITDLSLNMYPSLGQKKVILGNALDVYHSLGIETPKVAVVTAQEKVNPKMRETVEADTLAKMAESGELAECLVAGPISVDLAMDPESAIIKRYSSPVAGDADILLVPDITAGNIAAKLVTSVGGGRSCGIIIGAKVPLIILSRSATADDKYMSIVLSALVGAN